MELPGLIRVKPEQTALIDELARMMGRSFLEEGWSQEWLSALNELGTTDARKLEISQAIIRSNFTVGAPYSCVYALPDRSAAAGGYLSSDLRGRIWSDLEEVSMELMIERVLTPEEQRVLKARAEKMAPISNFKWMAHETAGVDFIHWYAIGVDSEKRGRGSFRKVFTPFLDYADKHRINCYLECYSDKTEAIYSHFGFEVVERFSDPAFSAIERCMRRRPA